MGDKRTNIPVTFRYLDGIADPVPRNETSDLAAPAGVTKGAGAFHGEFLPLLEREDGDRGGDRDADRTGDRAGERSENRAGDRDGDLDDERDE